jgi:hypothetical protein
MLLVNPRRRHRRRKMSALQKSYFSKNRRRRHHRRRSIFSRNPTRPTRVKSTFQANPRRRRHYFNRNPSNFSLDTITAEFGPAVIGAGGALIVDWVFGNIPLPATLTTGLMLPVTRILVAVGIGAAAGMIAGKATGEKVAVGALVVTSYSIIKNFLVTNVPQITLARFTPAASRLHGIGYVGPARGSQVPPAMRVNGIGAMLPNARSMNNPKGKMAPTMGRFIANR